MILVIRHGEDRTLNMKLHIGQRRLGHVVTIILEFNDTYSKHQFSPQTLHVLVVKMVRGLCLVWGELSLFKLLILQCYSCGIGIGMK